MGGKPIANKYCEGKMKRTLKRGLKDLKPLRRKQWKLANVCDALRKRRWMVSSKGPEAGTEEEPLRTEGKMRSRSVERGQDFPGSPEAWFFSTVRPEGLMRSCRNGFHRTVLKHGPRSQPNMRVCGCKTHRRNESKSKVPRRRPAASTSIDLL
jgi:hypothetical protein